MDPTVDPALRSFVEVAPESDFPIQNLPYGVFRPQPGDTPRVGAALGDWIVDLAVLEERGLLRVPDVTGPVLAQPTLAPLMAAGPAAWRAVRTQLSRLLRHDEPTLRDDVALRDQALVWAADAELLLPCAIGDYTDFYASRHHAEHVGRIFRGAQAALPPQYPHLPIGYHGRASSVVVSGTPVRRPQGQYRPAGAEAPVFGPTRELDYEVEVGWFIGRGNALGERVPIGRAANQIFGFVLVNDWSARDIQQWEYVPLGPFLGKNFATSISPWVVTPAALEPFRCAGPPQDPEPLPYLRAKGPQAYDVRLEAVLAPAGGGPPVVLTRTNLRELYWSPVQMIAHHTAGGCNLRPGDLLASGTVSGPAGAPGVLPSPCGCLLEITERGAAPARLPDGTTRAFLADGDTVILRGYCEGPCYRIGFGECRGTVTPAE